MMDYYDDEEPHLNQWSKPMISNALYEEIIQEATARSRRYQRDMVGRAEGQSSNPRDHLDWWVAEVALERGRDWTIEDADREVDDVFNATEKQILDDMRWRGKCPECAARGVDKAVAVAFKSVAK